MISDIQKTLSRSTRFAGALACLAFFANGAELELSLRSEKWIRHTIDSSSLGADGVRTADVNGDGLPDLVTGWEQGGVSRIYIMDRDTKGPPTWKQIDAGIAPSVEDALLVDLDEDGAMDVVSSTEGASRKILVHWAPELGENYTDSTLWKTETLFEDGSRWMFAVSMQIDGKLGPDIVVGGKGDGASIGWIECPENPRDAAAWQFHRLTGVTWVMSIIAEDMDGDGIEDVLVSERKGSREGVFWLKNPGPRHAGLRNPWPKTWLADDLHESNFIGVHDFDGDGDREVIVPYKEGDGIGSLAVIKHRNGRFLDKIPVGIPAFLDTPKAATAGDIDLDGRPDIVLSAENAGQGRSGIIWLSYPDRWDKPNWIAHDLSGPDGIKFDLNLLVDLDSDGDLDVVNTEEKNNARGGEAGLGLVWYENPTRN